MEEFFEKAKACGFLVEDIPLPPEAYRWGQELDTMPEGVNSSVLGGEAGKGEAPGDHYEESRALKKIVEVGGSVRMHILRCADDVHGVDDDSAMC